MVQAETSQTEALTERHLESINICIKVFVSLFRSRSNESLVPAAYHSLQRSAGLAKAETSTLDCRVTLGMCRRFMCCDTDGASEGGVFLWADDD